MMRGKIWLHPSERRPCRDYMVEGKCESKGLWRVSITEHVAVLDWHTWRYAQSGSPFAWRVGAAIWRVGAAIWCGRLGTVPQDRRKHEDDSLI